MDYQQSANYQQSINNLPSSSSNEKTLLWSQPYIDSGYNTSAPSISSIDAFLNEEQMDYQQSANYQQSINNSPSFLNWTFISPHANKTLCKVVIA